MASFRLNHRKIHVNIPLGIALIAAGLAAAQDIKQNVTYVCNGERIYVESCNMRDLSDTTSCMVAHPDRPTRNGIMAYTNETRGALKKLFPTCKQPTAQELAAAEAFKKKQQEIYDTNAAKANPQAAQSAPQPNTARQQGTQNQRRPAPPKNAEERAMRRCVSSGRLPATCTGNSLLGMFGQMVSQVLPSAAKEPAAGPDIAGAFEGAGGWRLDFIDGGVLVNCNGLAPDQHSYSFEFKNNRAAIVVNTTPKPLVLAIGADGKTITGPGPVVLDGVIVTGYDSGLRDATGKHVEAATAVGPVFNSQGQRVSRTSNQEGHATFGSKRVTCPAMNLSTKGASVGVQTMGTNLLKSMFNDGDSGPPTPAGIRMHGIFAASTGFSAQFFPESVILGCGPDAARAYPYTVIADGAKAGIRIDAPDHPLTLSFVPNDSLDAGTGAYQVHGRIVIGQDDKDDFTFAPMEQTCNLGILAPSKTIPMTGGTASNPSSPATGTSTLSTPDAPLGNATLTVTAGLAAQAGVPNPLAGRPYILLRESYASLAAKAGIAVPAGVSAFKFVGTVCANRSPDCQKMNDAIKVSAASAVRADVSGNGTFPGVPPGTYYLMISTILNKQPVAWGQAIQLKPGANSITLNQNNAVPIN